MMLTLNRHPSGPESTIGDLLVNDEFLCHTLEDVIRAVKIPGQTAIPAGTYRVEITWSPRFKRDLPLVVGVPNYTGVRFHALNRASETDGCIGVGEWTGGEEIHNSAKALEALMDVLNVASIAKQEITLEVCDP
jgi:hypothetical protein